MEINDFVWTLIRKSGSEDREEALGAQTELIGKFAPSWIADFVDGPADTPSYSFLICRGIPLERLREADYDYLRNILGEFEDAIKKHKTQRIITGITVFPDANRHGFGSCEIVVQISSTRAV